MDDGKPPARPALPVGLMVIGSEMAGFTVVGVLLDVFAFGTLPWLTIGLTVLGFLAAFYHLILFTRSHAEAAKQKRAAKPTPPGGAGG